MSRDGKRLDAQAAREENMDTTEAIIESNSIPRTVIRLYRAEDGQWYPSEASCSALDTLPFTRLLRDWPCEPGNGRRWQLSSKCYAQVVRSHK
jgi:hypothetical protein